jgi:hypothetical protein
MAPLASETSLFSREKSVDLVSSRGLNSHVVRLTLWGSFLQQRTTLLLVAKKLEGAHFFVKKMTLRVESICRANEVAL